MKIAASCRENAMSVHCTEENEENFFFGDNEFFINRQCEMGFDGVCRLIF